MEKIIKGQNYNFCIVADRVKFYIEAVHIASLRFSFINNLNTVLSEFNINIDNGKASKSQWLVSKKQSKLFFKKAVKFLSNKPFRNYIEKKLNEDRKYGEWENRKII